MAVKEKERGAIFKDAPDPAGVQTALAARGESVMTETAPVTDTGMIRRVFNEEERRRKRTDAPTVLRRTAMLGGGFFLASCPLPFSTYPLGIAFLSAVTGGVWEVLFALLGTVSGSFFITGGVYPAAMRYASAAMSVALVFARLGYGYWLGRRDETYRGRMFSEPVYARLTAGAATLVGFSLIRLLTEGVTVQNVSTFLFTVSAGISAGYLYICLFDHDRRYGKLYEAGMLFLVFTLAAATCSVNLFGCSLATLAAPFAASLFGAAGGQTRGGLTGAAAGCALCFGNALLSGGEIVPAAAAVLAVFGYLSGMFRDSGTVVRLIVPTAVGIGLSVCFFESSVLLTSVLFVSAAAVTTAFGSEIDAAGKRMFHSSGESTAAFGEYINGMMTRRRERDMKKLIRSFSALSEIFSNLSLNFKRPERIGVKSICKDVINKYCAECELRENCTAFNGDPPGNEKLIDRLSDGLRAGKNDAFFSECPAGDAISTELNDRISVMFEEAMKNDRAGLFSSEYESVSRLLSATASLGDEYKRDRLLSERLTKAFSGKEFFADVIAVCGRRRKAVVAGGTDISRSIIGASQIKGLCERVCGVSFSEPEFVAEERNMMMLLEQRRVYNIIASKRERKKNGEKICGDSSLMFYGDDRFYSVICDGMGSGNEAAVVSRICLTFTEKMLSGGNRTDVTLSMLNNFVRSKAEECTAAMDILSVDLLNGDGIFTKCGAAPSYVLRKNKIFKITSRTPPVGIMEQQRQDSLDFAFRSGDVFLMISDGALCETMRDDEFDRRMGELMRYGDGDTSETVAERILAFACENAVCGDDITVVVGRVSMNPEK